MNSSLVLGAIVVIPIILLIVLRINSALVFLSLCLGSVLVQFVAPDADSLFGLFTSGNFNAHSTGSNTIRLLLIAVPAILTSIFMIRTVKGHFKLAINVLPAIGVGLLSALLIVPLLSKGLQHNIITSSFWDQAQKSQDLIVGSSAMVCMFVLWLQRPKTGGKHYKS